MWFLLVNFGNSNIFILFFLHLIFVPLTLSLVLEEIILKSGKVKTYGHLTIFFINEWFELRSWKKRCNSLRKTFFFLQNFSSLTGNVHDFLIKHSIFFFLIIFLYFWKPKIYSVINFGNTNIFFFYTDIFVSEHTSYNFVGFKI